MSKQTAWERLRRVGQIACKSAIFGGVTVVLESPPDWNANAQLETVKQVSHPNVRIHFNTSNATLYGQGTDAVAELKKVIDYVGAVTLKDHNGQSMVWNFPPLGKGVVNFPCVLKLLEEHAFRGPIILEMPEAQGVEATEARTEQVIAESVAYIQSLGDFKFQWIDHSELMVYRTDDGREHPVQTAKDWAIRRSQILKGMELVFGELPDRSKLPPPRVKVLDRQEGDGYVRLNITYLAEENDWVPAHLYLPNSRPAGKRVPAMLALHPTSDLGKRRVSGEHNDPKSLDRAYAKQLAQRGYVVLAPDYPSFGDYRYDFAKSKYASGTMKAIFNNMRGADLLQAREEVDPKRLGVIGHSLGGHASMWVAAFDERFKVIVSSCGWCPYHFRNDISGGSQPRYAPRVRDMYGCDPNRLPYDFYEVVAALAPRWFFSNSPLHDGNFPVDGVRHAEPKAREVFALLGVPDHLQVRYPDCGHAFPAAVRKEAYEFVDRVFGHTPSRSVP